MKILTPIIAEDIARQIAPEISDPSMRDFFLVHSKNVVKIATILAKSQKIDPENIEIAGRIHDIGYSKDIDNHKDFAIPILEGMGYDVNNIIKDCILHHGYSDTPTTLEGRLFQLADKLSIFDTETIETMIQHEGFPLPENTLDFMKSMATRGIDLFQNFK